jgi:ubiquinone/menaquinone biosynthesis C-methylase UbiE
MTLPDWHWNEIQQIGTDYNSLAEVEDYDARMATFRDVDEENRRILAAIALPAGGAVLEIGCGTGRFARSAAAAGYRVSAVDVSAQMLAFVKKKTLSEGLSGIVLRHAGFLTMDFPDAHFDAVVSGAALHHLPDAWKLVALRNVSRVLKPRGQLLLRDVVFAPTAGESPEACFESFCSAFPERREEAAQHVAVEFSTYNWIMEGLLMRAGFDILSTAHPSASFSVYHCRKGDH